MCDPEAVDALTERGRANLLVHQLLGEPTALDRAVEAFREAAELLPPEHPARPVAAANLAGAVLIRFELDGASTDLLEAARSARAATALTVPQDHAA